ncbi:MAG: DUF362 domain-containing protein [Deltaproteobacteria bacterium]|nr:DUF362 domain-containing protein [Deltaproteobacteria bacterium]
MGKVYLVRGSSKDPDDLVSRQLAALWDRAGFGNLFEKGELVALKLHVGEPGNVTHVRPCVAKTLVALISKTGASVFLTDTSVLYKSPRSDAVGHAKVFHEHGFGLEAMGAPFIPADGLRGDEEIEVEVNGKHYDKVAIASGILHADSILLLSHATGHLAGGLGASLKNLGMGCVSRKAKLRQHHGQNPTIDPEACTACGTCARWCPAEAIGVDEFAVIDQEKCIGCGECVVSCRFDAVLFDWANRGPELQERIVEHAAGVMKGRGKPFPCITVAQSMTKDCDCIGKVQEPVVKDLGFLASMDPVALDQALLNLVREETGKSFDSYCYPEHDAEVQTRYAENLGIGSRIYETEIVDLT